MIVFQTIVSFAVIFPLKETIKEGFLKRYIFSSLFPHVYYNYQTWYRFQINITLIFYSFSMYIVDLFYTTNHFFTIQYNVPHVKIYWQLRKGSLRSSCYKFMITIWFNLTTELIQLNGLVNGLVNENSTRRNPIWQETKLTCFSVLNFKRKQGHLARWLKRLKSNFFAII